MTLVTNNIIRCNLQQQIETEQNAGEMQSDTIELFPPAEQYDDNSVPRSVAEAQHQLDSINKAEAERKAENWRIQRSEDAKKQLPKREAHLRELERQLEIYNNDLENNTHVGLAQQIREKSIFGGKVMGGILGISTTGGVIGGSISTIEKPFARTPLAITIGILAGAAMYGAGYLIGRGVANKKIKKLDDPNNIECLKYHANLLNTIKSVERDIAIEKINIRNLKSLIID